LNKTTKEYLKQTFKLDVEINTLIETVESLEASATKVTTILDPNKVGSGSFNIDSREQTIVKMCDLKNKINQKIDELVDLKSNVYEQIAKIDNSDYRLLLTLRYVNLKSFEEIAVLMNYTYRHITRLHGNALQYFEKMSYDVL
jgi:DNA-directed RNA polymerase specialized sigma subunit